MRLAHHMVPLALVFLGKSQLPVILDQVFWIEYAHDEFLAERGGQRRDADVDLAIRQVHRETPVLRQQAHGDIEVRQRTVDVAQAFRNGADYIVVGRPIRQAADPRAAAEALQRTIATIFPR